MRSLNEDRETFVPQQYRPEPAQTAMPRRAFVFRTLLASGVGVTGASLAAELVNAVDSEPVLEVDPFQAEVDARLALIVARHGARLDDAARVSIRRDVEALVKRGQTLKAVALTNADEPSPTFQVYRANAE